MRIVSLLPSTTEILFAVGAGDQVVGVTFECDTPVEARERRIVSTTAIPEGLSPRDIDTFVTKAMAAGEDLYHLDAGALADLDADLVVTQDLCAVCAVDVSVVDDALAYLGCRAEVLTIDPHTLDEVLASVATLGEATGRDARAAELVADLRARLHAVESAVRDARRPRALVLEWTDPAFAPGHWVPEMVTRAGGVNALGTAGEKSVRVSWEAVRESAPEVIVCAPCGYDLEGSAALARKAIDDGELPPRIPVWAVDANASFARPGPRLVDGVEALAGILHPDAAQPPQPEMARRLR
ncbi:iron complex transport system substrate-binding protein [Pedococcus dokdonensis]|uniref:Iron complex transport system substrate-binding protein n=1 Tax=Pedococcus dokdonensis TaxID=443156 RepID=A0A1H0S6U9_9MICO|nr:cobalamin-binding protein [Pedococcus dokdonensis]SDP36946.1 iron complex transport system substrate-binding protein [Pedococcus dokdonensis]